MALGGVSARLIGSRNDRSVLCPGHRVEGIREHDLTLNVSKVGSVICPAPPCPAPEMLQINSGHGLVMSEQACPAMSPLTNF